MARFAIGFVASFIFLSVSLAAQKDQTFTGEITDRFCTKSGSHDMMMRRHGAKNTHDCIIACVKAGGKYVLFDGATKTTYQLDDQRKPEQFAERKVRVTGTYDKATETIHVKDIQPVS
jgi:hypothetical protein